MRSPLVLSLLLLVSFLAMPSARGAEPAKETDDPFPELTRLDTELGFSLYYDPKLSEVQGAPNRDPVAMDESGVEIERPLRTRLNGDGEWFLVSCDHGPSADLSCTVFRETAQGLGKVASLDGEHFYFPGNGSVYTEGKNNRTFNARRKFILRDGKLTEVRQPFYYVGLDSVALVDLELYSSKDFSRRVARLPKGTRVTVLLSETVDEANGEYDPDSYLVKTPFGLVGWIRSEINRPPVIGDLLHYGD